MEKLPFKATIRNIGTSMGVTIPKDYLDNGLLTEGKTYKFEVVEEIKEPTKKEE